MLEETPRSGSGAPITNKQIEEKLCRRVILIAKFFLKLGELGFQRPTIKVSLHRGLQAGAIVDLLT